MARETKGRGSSRVSRPRVLTKEGVLDLKSVVGSNRQMYPLERQEDLSEMVRLVLDGYTFADVAKELSRRRWDKGEECYYSAAMVRADVEGALKEWREANAGEAEKVISRALAKCAVMDRRLAEDYEKSRKADGKVTAALLKQGVSLEEIRKMEFAGNPDIILARKALMEQELKILGLNKGAVKSEGGSKNVYNFEGLSPDQMLEIVRGLQDRKYAEVKGVDVPVVDVEVRKDDGFDFIEDGKE